MAKGKFAIARQERLLFLIPLLILVLGVVVPRVRHWYQITCAAVPPQSLALTLGNTDGRRVLGANWDTGVAAIHLETAFSVFFEGHSFGSNIRGPNKMLVDFRRERWKSFSRQASPITDVWNGDDGEMPKFGVETRFSSKDRLFSLRYKGHQLDYSHHKKTLRIGGKEFSLANGPIRLLVKKDGQVVPAPKIVRAKNAKIVEYYETRLEATLPTAK